MLPRHLALIKRLDTEDEQVRDEVVSVLASMGKKMVRPLTIALIESPSKNVQLGAIEALGRIGDIETADTITFSLYQDPFFSSLPTVLKALIRIGEKTDYERIVKYLLRDLDCENDSAVYSARIMYGIGCLITYATYSHKRLGEISKYKSILINALYSRHRLVRFVAGFALSDIGSVRPILKALEFYKDKEIRKDATLILKNIAYEYIMQRKGKDDISAIRKALYRACVDDDKEVRKIAKTSLDYIASVIKFEKSNKLRKNLLRNSFLKIFKDLTITEEDCGCENSVFFSEIIQRGRIKRPLKRRIIGRCCGSDIRWGEKGDVIVRKGEFITKTIANELEKAGKEVIRVRSVIHCQAKEGICLKCFGKYNFAGDAAKIGEKIGNKAASWWARLKFNKHLIELLEACRPESPAIICEKEGMVCIYENKSGETIINILSNGLEKEYIIPKDRMIVVDEMDEILRGQELTDGRLDPSDIFRIMGANRLRGYIIDEMLHYMPPGNFDERLIELFIKQTTHKEKLSFEGMRFEQKRRIL